MSEHSRPDFYPLLARAVASLDRYADEARTALYDRAREALVEQLRSVNPPLDKSVITRAWRALEEAICKVEIQVIYAPSASSPRPRKARRRALQHAARAAGDHPGHNRRAG